MATKVVMPKLGMAMTEGMVVKWLRGDGDQVQMGEAIALVMSEKITYELDAPAAGILRHVARLEENKVVGEAIAYITEPGEEVPKREKVAVPMAVEAIRAPMPLPEEEPKAEERAERRISPLARKLARERGIDIAQLKGTGPGGRVVEADVRRAMEAREKTPAPVEVARPRTIPFVGMRRAIAKRVVDSLQAMAQVTLTTEADMTETVRLREQLRQEFDLTYTDIIVKAVAKALERHPLLNATLVGEEIQILEEINVGVAVALEGGLIVPVIRGANKLGLQELAQEAKRLAQRARDNVLSVDEVTGGTFTITNLGMYDVDGFTPIINPPEVAILGVGRIVEKPALYRGEISKRLMMTLSLTFDHRVVDGAPAADFLRTVKSILESPYLLFT